MAPPFVRIHYRVWHGEVLVWGFISVLIGMASQVEVLLVSQIYAAFIFSTVKILQSVPSMPATETTTKACILSTSSLNWRDDMAEALWIRLEKLELRLLTKHGFV